LDGNAAADYFRRETVAASITIERTDVGIWDFDKTFKEKKKKFDQKSFLSTNKRIGERSTTRAT
jgi:hypothetical protein